jgi:hypothetical protein
LKTTKIVFLSKPCKEQQQQQSSLAVATPQDLKRMNFSKLYKKLTLTNHLSYVRGLHGMGKITIPFLYSFDQLQ